MKNILCAVDLSEYSKLVVDCAAALARHFNARLTIIHSVYSPNDPIYGSTEFERGGELSRKIVQAREKIETLMHDCSVVWESRVLSGDPVEQIAQVANHTETDMVIAASYGISGFKRLLIGTVVERMARKIMRPFLVLRMPPDQGDPNRKFCFPEMNHILAACDLKNSSAVFIRLAAFMAQSFNAVLHLVHVMESPVTKALDDLTAGPYSEIQDALIEKAKQKLAACVPADLCPGLQTEVILGQGTPAEQIQAIALKLRADMIVIGVRYHLSFEKLLVGSTTESILRHSPCAVLVVPDAEEAVHEDALKGMTKKTGIVRDDRYLNHVTGKGHPETFDRLAALYEMVDGSSLAHHLITVSPRRADEEEILMVHSHTYLKQVAGTQKKERGALAQDTLTSSGSYETALLAAGGLFEIIKQVVAGEVANGFALIRPPGHHAERNRAMGYCLFNNVALGAVYAQRHLGLERVLIVDWDVHHGNGTQHAFEDDPSVLFFSIHQFPHFPGTGLFTETGIGSGEGYTVNIPLPGGYGPGDYVSLLERALKPLALEFKPDLVLVSAGFDIHPSDPLGNMRVSSEGFAAMTRVLMDIADTSCRGRLVCTLEGGYDLPSLKESVRAVLMEMAGLSLVDVSGIMADADEKRVNYALQRLRHVHGNFWQCFT
jgi:acetoin utilization deacetylase AcuC-like enzyme/nucleotide-binding universal stress UspA family protein